MISVNGKNILVTGASGGMGRILCKQLDEMGANLCICSNDEKGLMELKDELKGNVYAKVVDITCEKSVKDFFEESVAKFGKLYAMANLAGLSIPGKIHEMSVEDFETTMNVNVKGTFLVGKYFANNAEKPAIIVNIGSTAAKNANPNAPLYCTAKAAVNMLSEGMLLQMGGIRVTTINPGGADTAFWGTRTVDKTKLMQAEDVVEVIMFAITSSPNVEIHDIYFESSARF